MANWDVSAVKAQLRLTAHRLGQLQERNDSQGQIARKEIAALLNQGNAAAARSKAQDLVQNDSFGDLYEALEMYIGLILEHFGEIDQSGFPSPMIAEASASIIFAAPHADSKDLQIVSEMLAQRLGPDRSWAAMGNLGNHVSARVAKTLSAPAPSATSLNDLLSDIAKAHGVMWIPEPRRHDIGPALLEMLDPASSPVVDMIQLRRLSSKGLPDDPASIRPRIWKLFLGTLPPLKVSWDMEIHKQRESYYDLLRRLLTPLANLPAPGGSLSPTDSTLSSIQSSISRLPSSLFDELQDEPEVSPLSLLDPASDIRLECAPYVDDRLAILVGVQESHKPTGGSTPEIRLEFEPGYNASPLNPIAHTGRKGTVPTTLHSAKEYHSTGGHPKHISALLRLLYLHSCLNPLNHSPHIPSLLVPLYSVFSQETEPKDAAHVEADTFWAFEAMIGEFSELEDEEVGSIWMKKLSERLSWADKELAVNLHSKGLDPALPHYSYRWLAPLMTQTLPLPAVYLTWDALFSCPMRERENNPKLDHLLDICTTMLVRARTPLFNLGKAGRRISGLWGDETAARPPSPLRPWELNDAFQQGMSLLQLYPVEAAGGIDRILQAASDLAQRRIEEARAPKTEALGIAARFKVSMWKGFANQLSTPTGEEDEESEEEEDSHDDGNETETPQHLSAPGLGSRLANTVWRGITNQSSMDVPLSPIYPHSPAASSTNSPLITPSSIASSKSIPSLDISPEPSPSPTISGPGIWEYAEKLKESDAAASLAKVSSNWRAKAMNAWSSRRKNSVTTEPVSPTSSTISELPPNSASWTTWSRSPMSEPEDDRRASSSRFGGSDAYSPPPKPAFFRQPRDSWMPAPRSISVSSASPETSPHSDSNFVHRTRASLASMAGLGSTPSPIPKTGPRPLMLNSSQLITAPKPRSISRSATNTPVPNQWGEVMRKKSHIAHRDSQSSISSLSPADALGVGRPTWKGSRSEAASESDSAPSRVVPINRRSVSPMAPVMRGNGATSPPSRYSSTGISPQHIIQRSPSESPSERGWGQVDIPDSLPGSSPSIPETPAFAVENVEVRVGKEGHRRLGSVVLADSKAYSLEQPPIRKPARRQTPPVVLAAAEDTSDSSAPPTPILNSRVRSKRYPQKPSNLRGNNTRVNSIEKTPSPNSLAPEWPDEQEVSVPTPRAADFETNEPSSESPTSPRSPIRPRKLSTEGRTRKISNESRDVTRKRESAADEGDDEGYDDFLSAYESEDPSKAKGTAL